MKKINLATSLLGLISMSSFADNGGETLLGVSIPEPEIVNYSFELKKNNLVARKAMLSVVSGEGPLPILHQKKTEVITHVETVDNITVPVRGEVTEGYHIMVHPFNRAGHLRLVMELRDDATLTPKNIGNITTYLVSQPVYEFSGTIILSSDTEYCESLDKEKGIEFCVSRL